MPEGVYTTEQVARICNVAGATVRRWVDSGALKGFRIPNTGPRPHRRVLRADLEVFMVAHNIPLEWLKGK